MSAFRGRQTAPAPFGGEGSSRELFLVTWAALRKYRPPIEGAQRGRGSPRPSTRTSCIICFSAALRTLRPGFAAAGPHLRFARVPATVVAAHLNAGVGFVPTEVATVDDQAFFGALHLDYDFGDRGVGKVFKAGADTTFDRVDAGNRFEVDQAVQVGDEVGQVVIGGAQVDGSF